MAAVEVLKLIRKGTVQVVRDTRRARGQYVRYREKTAAGRWKYIAKSNPKLKSLKKTYPASRFPPKGTRLGPEGRAGTGTRAGRRYGGYQGGLKDRTSLTKTGKPAATPRRVGKSPMLQRRVGMGKLARMGQGKREIQHGLSALLKGKGKRAGLGITKAAGRKLLGRGALGLLGPIGDLAMLAWLGYDIGSAAFSSAQSDEDMMESFLRSQYADEMAGELGTEMANTRSESEYIGNMADLADTDKAMTRALHTDGSAMSSELQMLVGGDTRVLQELAQQPAQPGLAEVAAQYGAL